MSRLQSENKDPNTEEFTRTERAIQFVCDVASNYAENMLRYMRATENDIEYADRFIGRRRLQDYEEQALIWKRGVYTEMLNFFRDQYINARNTQSVFEDRMEWYNVEGEED